MNLRCSRYYFCCWKVTYITLSLNLGVRWGRTRMSCDFINNQIICSIQCKQRDGTISSARIDSVLYAAKWMLTVLRGCAKAGQVTCLMHDISLECTVHWQRDTKQGWRACVLNILIDMQASSRATPFPCKLKSLPGNWAGLLNRSLPEQTGRREVVLSGETINQYCYNMSLDSIASFHKVTSRIIIITHADFRTLIGERYVNE